MTIFRRARADRSDGQALVEFSIVVIPFLILLMGVIDLGVAVYSMNGTSQAAREIARTTSAHPWNDGACCDLGSSTQAQAAISTQRLLIPRLEVNPSTDITCFGEEEQAVIDDNECHSGDYIQVVVRAPFRPVTPLLSSFGEHTFMSYSRMQIP